MVTIWKFKNLSHNIRNIKYCNNNIFKDWIVFTLFEWCYTLPMSLLYSKFQIFSSLQLLPLLSQLIEIWEILTISNYNNSHPWLVI